MPTLRNVLLALACLWASTTGADSPRIGLGLPLGEEELAAFEITVFPNGRNLPPGSGGVPAGERIYRAQCAMCHGEKGIEGPATRLAGSDGFFDWNDPLRILRINRYPMTILSTGARWPYATTIFDYVRRAMPHTAPKSLSDDEVYAITAYLLHLNGLVEENAVMNAQSLPKVTMPAAARSVSAGQ